MIRTNLSKRIGPAKSSTPQIIIRLLGLSIRNHAVSTAEIFSRLGTVIRGVERTVRGGERSTHSSADARAEIACAFRFALK
jgi:hypothetical protein